jgi:hypothetical protein
MKRKFTIILVGALLFSIFLNLFLARDLLVFDEKVKARFYNRVKKLGWLDEKVPFTQIRDSGTMIALAFGQSNAASTSNEIYVPRNPVLSYYKGNLYKAKEPLLGSGGDGGCVWTILGDKLIDSGMFKKVVLIPIAVGATRIEDWTEGMQAKRLNEVLTELGNKGITLTHIFWHQGESNTGDKKENYKAHLGKLLTNIRNHKQYAPFYCSVATYNFYIDNKLNGVDTTLQQAQMEFVAENPKVLLGPDTDKLIYAIDRFDSQHFSGIGNFKYADLWYRAIKMEIE